MNYGKWNKVTSPYRVLAKLIEEIGEVGKAWGMLTDATARDEQNKRRGEIIEELKHVEFMAIRLRRILEGRQEREEMWAADREARLANG